MIECTCCVNIFAVYDVVEYAIDSDVRSATDRKDKLRQRHVRSVDVSC